MISGMFTKIPIGLLPYAFIPKGGNFHTSLLHSPEIGAVCPSYSDLGLTTIRTPTCMLMTSVVWAQISPLDFTFFCLFQFGKHSP